MNKFVKFLVFLFCLLQVNLSIGQGTFHNYGNVQVHKNGNIGFHSDLVNDGVFSESKGLIGFFSEFQSSISGTSSPTFYDLEVAVENNLFIDIPITVCNSLNFIYGSIQTARSDKNIYVQLAKQASYEGAVDMSKIDGHVAIKGQKEFMFPVGYQDKLRPLGIRFVDGVFFAKCEYYAENPNNPLSFYENFDTSKKPITIGEISTNEFWGLGTTGTIQVTLTWEAESNLSSKIDEIENVIVVGWSKEKEQWENLGNALFEGNLETGTVSSNPFNANNYEVFTIGSSFKLSHNIPANYVITPNSDGINDNLVIKLANQSQKNILKIFDESGKLVYEMSSYKGEFSGTANRGSGAKLLPKGTYFYFLELTDLNMKHSGYLYIQR